LVIAIPSWSARFSSMICPARCDLYDLLNGLAGPSRGSRRKN
jgi:hypothetical protein